MTTAPPTVAVFGGSFDPPHVGHVLVPGLVLSLTEADRFLVVPSFQHPFAKDMSSFEHRVQLCHRAFAPYGDPVEISTVEEEMAQDGQGNRTLDVLLRLQELNPEHRVRLVIGTDILMEADRWHRFDRIEEQFTPIVVGRTGFPGPDGREILPYLPDVRSRDLRRSLREGDLNLDAIPVSVRRYIREHGLYP